MPVRFLPYSLGTPELASPSTSPPYPPHSDLNRSQKISFIHCAQGVSRDARTESSREESRDEQAVGTEAYLPFRRYLPVSFQLRIPCLISRGRRDVLARAAFGVGPCCKTRLLRYRLPPFVFAGSVASRWVEGRSLLQRRT